MRTKCIARSMEYSIIDGKACAVCIDGVDVVYIYVIRISVCKVQLYPASSLILRKILPSKCLVVYFDLKIRNEKNITIAIGIQISSRC